MKGKALYSEERDILEMFYRDAKKHQLLSQEEELTVAKNIRLGDQKAFNRLIEANMRFVCFIVNNYWSPGLPLLDMLSEGCLGLMRAAEKFDPDKGYRFTTYASWWITSRVKRLRKGHWKHTHDSLNAPLFDDEVLTVEEAYGLTALNRYCNILR